MESEYVVATHAAKELYWIKKLLYNIAPELDNCITLHCDNEVAIALIHSENYHAHTKHMNICYEFIHKGVATSMLQLEHCAMDEMTADVLTKLLPPWKTTIHAVALGLQNCFASLD